jgi:polyisoprenoid-binding protein YceI
LKSDDFFSVATFPTSTFTVTSSVAMADDKGNTHEITGNLTIKGITKQITFPAKVAIEGNTLNATAVFTIIDRAQWEVKYGSETFADLAKDNVIENSVELTLNIVAMQQQS